MSETVSITFAATDLEQIIAAPGHVALFVAADGKLDPAGRRVNRVTKGALERLVASEAFTKLKAGAALSLGFPAGMAAEAVHVVRLERRPESADARKAGVTLAKVKGSGEMLVAVGNIARAQDIALGLALRAYGFDVHKSGEKDGNGAVVMMATNHDALASAAKEALQLAEGVLFTRDLVNEPANVLTTTEFALRLKAMEKLGLKVEVLEEPELEKLGMGSLLSVGQGSASPSKVVVMQWLGGKKGDAPFALVGKGVVFDTGGISLKPAAGMEDMTMDMGGAGVVAGVMRALALRGAKANVVGLVGLVENMPSGTATRPGDVVKSMKGTTIEVINTDAEGRLVLADVLWYAQERFKPCGMINLATLTGAVIVALGHENAGVFSNNDGLCKRFLKAAASEGEGAWRMPLGAAYDEMIKSNIADIKNSAGREAGSVTAAQFLQRFVRDDMPWIHLDIAGVAHIKAESSYAPKWATGWGVLALNRLIQNNYEG